MISVQRRGFLVGLAALIASKRSALGAPSFASSQLRLKDYGAALDGVTDDTPALQAALADADALTWGTRRIGWSGPLKVTSTINLGRNHLEGDDGLGSIISRGFPAAGGPLISLATINGGGLHNFSSPSNAFTPGSILIYSAATNVYAADRFIAENLYLSSGIRAHAPFRNIHLVGVGRVSPPGIREPILRDITCFGATGGNIYTDSMMAMRVAGLHTYSFGAGTGTDGNVYFAGTGQYGGQDNQLSGLDIEGQLHVLNQWNFVATGGIAALVWNGAGGNIRIVCPVPPAEYGARPQNTGVW